MKARKGKFKIQIFISFCFLYHYLPLLLIDHKKVGKIYFNSFKTCCTVVEYGSFDFLPICFGFITDPPETNSQYIVQEMIK